MGFVGLKLTFGTHLIFLGIVVLLLGILPSSAKSPPLPFLLILHLLYRSRLLGGKFRNVGYFIQSPQAIPSKASRDFFFTITISPISESSVGSTKISKPFLAAKESAPT